MRKQSLLAVIHAKAKGNVKIYQQGVVVVSEGLCCCDCLMGMVGNGEKKDERLGEGGRETGRERRRVMPRSLPVWM